MLRKLTIMICLISFGPVAAGAQDVALLVNSQPVVQQAAVAEPAREINLAIPAEKTAKTMVAANDLGSPEEATRQAKSHSGTTFQEFAEIHFGGYRWLYWVGAAAVIVVIHVFAVHD